MCEQNAIFPFVRSRLCGFSCEIVNGFAVAVGRKKGKWENGDGDERLALSFL